jgi:hypothetical protein
MVVSTEGLSFKMRENRTLKKLYFKEENKKNGLF